MQVKDSAILLIEDNPDHAELIMRLLRGYDNEIQIHHISDGKTALDYLARQAPFVDPLPRLILLDLRIPKIDGLDVLKQIKRSEALRPIPVVVLSTSEAEDDIARACRLYANSYLVKPMDLGAFDNLVEMIWRYWLIWNRH
jgi:CheY-like chemotaxis protein